MEKELLQKALNWVEQNWHKQSTKWIAPLVAGVIVLFIASSSLQKWPVPIGWVFVASSIILVFLWWNLLHRMPKTPDGKVGFVISLACEDATQEKQVKSDLINHLKSLLSSNQSHIPFHIVVLPNYMASQIDDRESALSALGKVRGHYMIFGEVKRRTINSKPKIYLKLNGAVRHSTIPMEISNDIAEDFRNVIPERVTVDIDNDVLGFEATSEMLDIGSRYIIGLAAFVSLDFKYAEALLIQVEQRLKQFRNGVANELLAERLPKRFAALYMAWGTMLIRRQIRTRDPNMLQELCPITEKRLQYTPQDYGALLNKMMCAFLLHRDIATVKKCINKCRKLRIKDAAWRYSAAFLEAYQGNMLAARREYESAFKGEVADASVPTQVEEFISQVLEEEPDKTQLHFCLGYINLYAKEDEKAAERDFIEFLRTTPDEKFAQERAIASEFLAKRKAA